MLKSIKKLKGNREIETTNSVNELVEEVSDFDAKLDSIYQRYVQDTRLAYRFKDPVTGELFELSSDNCSTLKKIND